MRRQPIRYEIVSGKAGEIGLKVEGYCGNGWQLYGAPFQLTDNIVAQAVILYSSPNPFPWRENVKGDAKTCRS